MQKTLRWSSLVLLAAGILLLFIGSSIQAQDDEEVATYIGQQECASCHRGTGRGMDAFCEDAINCHGTALIDVSAEEDKSVIQADFEQAEELRMVQLPGESEPRPFTADDIAYVIGSGRYVQRYVYQAGDAEYLVLPAEWDTINQVWGPLDLGSNWPDDYNFGEKCIGCHVTGLDVETMTWVDDGVWCEACHGPGSLHAALGEELPRRPSDEEWVEFRASIHNSPDPQICGQCHSYGMATDGIHHFPVDYRPGGNLLDSYILADSDELWWPDGQARHSNMQYMEWLNTSHSTSLASVTGSEVAQTECLKCHSVDYDYNQAIIAAHEDGDREGPAPDPVSVQTAEYDVTCIACHNVHTEDPEVQHYVDQDKYVLCASCHSDSDAGDGVHHPVLQMYQGDALIDEVAAVPSAHFTAEDGPDCVACHMPRTPIDTFTLASHSMHIVSPGAALDIEELEDSCSSCHEEQASPAAMQALIDDIQASVVARVEAARAALTGDEPAWVPLALDFVAGDGSNGVHNYAYADALLDAVESELDVTGETMNE